MALNAISFGKVCEAGRKAVAAAIPSNWPQHEVVAPSYQWDRLLYFIKATDGPGKGCTMGHGHVEFDEEGNITSVRITELS